MSVATVERLDQTNILKRRKYWTTKKRQYRLDGHKNELMRFGKERYVKKVKRDVISYYSNGTNKCNCCGEPILEFLCIDHIYGNGKEERELHGNGNAFYSWLRLSNYPTGYQVLCFNCNNGKRIVGFCPHKRKEYGF